MQFLKVKKVLIRLSSANLWLKVSSKGLQPVNPIGIPCRRPFVRWEEMRRHTINMTHSQCVCLCASVRVVIHCAQLFRGKRLVSYIMASVMNPILIGNRLWLSFADMLVILWAISGSLVSVSLVTLPCTCSLCLTFMNSLNLQHLHPCRRKSHLCSYTHTHSAQSGDSL